MEWMKWPDGVELAKTNDNAHVLLLSSVAANLPSGAYIAGGALTRLFSRTTGGDIDVFCEHEAALKNTLKMLRINPPAGYWNRAVCEPPLVGDDEDNEPHSHGWTTDPALPGLAPIQVIGGGHFKSPEEQAVRFDFVCCQMVLTSTADGLIFASSPGAISDARSRIVRIANKEEPHRYGQRIAKYRRKGFKDADDILVRESINKLLGAADF